MADEFKFEIEEGFDHVIEETGNMSTNLRKVKWGSSANYKLDLRKWFYKDGEEKCGKGIGLTDDGASELVKVLSENGYGDTKEIIHAIKDRDDFKSSMKAVFGNSESEDYDNELEEYYDPKELLGSM